MLSLVVPARDLLLLLQYYTKQTFKHHSRANSGALLLWCALSDLTVLHSVKEIDTESDNHPDNKP